MSGKEIDKVRARGALEVIKQHPAMVLFAISPVLVAAVLLCVLTDPVWGILLFVVAALTGAWVVVRRR